MAREIHGHEGTALGNSIRIMSDERDENAGNGAHDYVLTLVAEEGKATPPTQFIHFQHGPLKESGLNGISDEALIAIVIDRLEGFQTGPFRSRYNALAITKMEEAMHWLNARTADRQKRGVEGFNKV